ncbi:MAG: hypothetical protein Q9225_000541 [Loekoesia sp. 1 TL-2023]
MQDPKDRKVVAALVQRLKSEGFLQLARGGKFARIDSHTVAAKRKQIYCNPMTFISHCYEFYA